MSAPPSHFKHCPACGDSTPRIAEKSMVCAGCGFTYFFNPTIGLAGFIENEKGELLLIKRAKEPERGKWAPPGGFADIGENAETALSREVMEEVGMRIDHWKYLHSAVNFYTYKDVTYPVLDFFYTARARSGGDLSLCPKETLSAEWICKDSIQADSLAFPSMREAFRAFMKH